MDFCSMPPVIGNRRLIYFVHVAYIYIIFLLFRFGGIMRETHPFSAFGNIRVFLRFEGPVVLLSETGK